METLVPSRRTPRCVSSSFSSEMARQPSSPGVPLGEVPHRRSAGVHQPLGRPERTFPSTSFLPAQDVSSPYRSSRDLPSVAKRDSCHPILHRPPSLGGSCMACMSTEAVDDCTGTYLSFSPPGLHRVPLRPYLYSL